MTHWIPELRIAGSSQHQKRRQPGPEPELTVAPAPAPKPVAVNKQPLLWILDRKL